VLWRACAGPLVEVPQRDERVFYFLQGHLEQVLALPLAAAEFFGFCPSILAGSERVMMTRFFLLLLLFVQLQEPTDPALLAEQIKMFQVPYKILCKVVNVELKVISLSLSLSLSGVGEQREEEKEKEKAPVKFSYVSLFVCGCRPRRKPTRCSRRLPCSLTRM
jgi:hypothetical protein